MIENLPVQYLEKLIIFWLTDSAFLEKRAEIISNVNPDIFEDLELKEIFEVHRDVYSGKQCRSFSVTKMLECCHDELGYWPYRLDMVLSRLQDEKNKKEIVAKTRDLIVAHGKGEEFDLDQKLKEIVAEAYEKRSSEKVNVRDILDDVMEERETGGRRGFSTGVGFIDKNTKGLRGGHFYIIGGYTNVGKTGMMLAVVDSVCRQKGEVLIFSLEMTKVDLVDRLLRYNEWKLKNDAVAIDAVAEYSLKVFTQKIKLDDIFIAIKSQVKKPNVVFIDFLQNIEEEGKTEYEKITSIARRLQLFALNEEICIFALSQIPQSAADQKDRVVISFKGSGALAAACDVGIFISKKKSPQEIDIATIEIVKNRFGRQCGEDFDFDKSVGFIRF